MRKISISLLPVLIACIAGCLDGTTPKQTGERAYCAMVENCNYGSFDTCLESVHANLDQSPTAECRAARQLLLECLGNLSCTDYLLWSESHPEQNFSYPCRDQDQLVDVTCNMEETPQ